MTSRSFDVHQQPIAGAIEHERWVLTNPNNTDEDNVRIQQDRTQIANRTQPPGEVTADPVAGGYEQPQTFEILTPEQFAAQPALLRSDIDPLHSVSAEPVRSGTKFSPFWSRDKTPSANRNGKGSGDGPYIKIIPISNAGDVQKAHQELLDSMSPERVETGGIITGDRKNLILGDPAIGIQAMKHSDTAQAEVQYSKVLGGRGYQDGRLVYVPEVGDVYVEIKNVGTTPLGPSRNSLLVPAKYVSRISGDDWSPYLSTSDKSTYFGHLKSKAITTRDVKEAFRTEMSQPQPRLSTDDIDLEPGRIVTGKSFPGARIHWGQLGTQRSHHPTEEALKASLHGQRVYGTIHNHFDVPYWSDPVYDTVASQIGKERTLATLSLNDVTSKLKSRELNQAIGIDAEETFSGVSAVSAEGKILLQRFVDFGSMDSAAVKEVQEAYGRAKVESLKTTQDHRPFANLMLTIDKYSTTELPRLRPPAT